MRNERCLSGARLLLALAAFHGGSTTSSSPPAPAAIAGRCGEGAAWAFALRQQLDQGKPGLAGDDQGLAAQAPLVQNLALCLQSRLIGLVPVHNPDPGPAQRFNQVITETTTAGAPYQALALPLVGNGLLLRDLDLLALEGSRHCKAEQLIEHLSQTLNVLGKNLSQDGVGLEGAVLRTRLQDLITLVLEQKIPLLRRLGAWV